MVVPPPGCYTYMETIGTIYSSFYILELAAAALMLTITASSPSKPVSLSPHPPLLRFKRIFRDAHSFRNDECYIYRAKGAFYDVLTGLSFGGPVGTCIYSSVG